MRNIKRDIEIENFIRDYIKKNQCADRLNKDFHDKFTEKFGGYVSIQPFGSSPNRLAMRWLKRLYEQGILDRWVIGLHAHETGFPNWIYSYTLRR